MADTDPGSIFDAVADDAEAVAAYRAGRFVPHDKVAAWLDSWEHRLNTRAQSPSRIERRFTTPHPP